METYLGIDWEEVKTMEELLAGRMDQLARKKEVLKLGYKRMMETGAKLVWYLDSRMAHRLWEPLAPGDMVLAYNNSLEDQWGKLFHNRWNGPYRVVEQAPGKSYVLEELDGTRMARRFVAAHIKRFYARGNRLQDQEEEEGVEEAGWVFEPELGFGRLDRGFTGAELGFRRLDQVLLEWTWSWWTALPEVGPGFTGAELGFRRLGRVFEAELGFQRLDWEMGLGWVIPIGGQNMTPGEFLPGVQKSCQIFDSCPGRQGYLRTEGIRRMDMDGAEDGHGRMTGGSGVRRSWIGNDGDIIRAGGGCGRRFGKGGAERGFCWILQDFEEEGVAQKLGGGAHQGQSGWSKTTGAVDL
ncbi:hypothetical protein PPACK8108_LOCUS15531 [Phakopsora pachyrhizi]|uniref:Uncharacterized protein n=1 Tax=Phakopsora pachyrhizi TaxID=170000 RepID=A0AAV0BBR4_PHAPC|nr:hypothetical protein PPACK8108_LOCUS15531 [Phakopsora pachyrhizi]